MSEPPCRVKGRAHDLAMVTDRDFQIITVAPDGSSLEENCTGGWAACDQCARLVRARKRRALLARAMAAVTAASPGEHAAHRARVEQVHAAFFASRPHPARRMYPGS